MKNRIPEALRIKLSEAGKRGWKAKMKKYRKVKIVAENSPLKS